MKTLTIRQLASIKRTAQNVCPMVTKKNKIAAKIAELGQQFNEINEQIKGWEGAVIAMTGMTSENIVRRVVTPVLDENGNQKLDANGQPMKMTKYEPNMDILTYDEDKKVYIINETTEPANEDTQVAEEAPEATEEAPAEAQNNDPWGE